MFFKDLQIGSHGPLPSAFVIQEIESPSVLRRDVVEDMGIRRNVSRVSVVKV